MKTIIYLPTLLALTIHVIVNGQTQNNQIHKIRFDILTKKQPVKMHFTNSNITMSESDYKQLLDQAKVLNLNAKKLREEAFSVEQESLIKQIEASELSAQISSHKFKENREVIMNVFSQISQNSIIYFKSYNLFSESERFMKLAKEMREEGNAQLTLQAKYGNFSNAEEKEQLALAKQQDVLVLFENRYPQLLQEMKFINQQEDVIEKSSLANDISSISQLNQSNPLSNQLFETLKIATNLKSTAQELRKIAETSAPNEKKVLNIEAISFENDYLVKQLEASVLRAKLTYEKFYKNKMLINSLLANKSNNAQLVNKVNQLNEEAEHLLKIAIEMREEGNAQLTIQSKYGAMSNAEEKEGLAIGKQYESIQIIEKNNSVMTRVSR